MKIERDKWYVTRIGNKVRVVCVDAPGTMAVVGVNHNDSIDTWRADGGYFSAGPESANDLVSEYVEPPKPREVWVNVANPALAGCAWYERELNDLDSDTLAKLVKFREVIEA